jgi:hypothetical protein
MSSLKNLLQCTSISILLWIPLQGQQSRAIPENQENNKCVLQGRVKAEAEYLYWWTKHSPKTVPLVTTGPVVANRTPVLGQPGVSIVLGDEEIKMPPRSGGRFTLSYGFGHNQIFSTEASYLFLIERSKTKSVKSNGSANSKFLALPFFDVTTDSESSTRIALPGSFSGKATLKVSNDMQGAEWNWLARAFCNHMVNLKALLGFRYWNFNEHLRFNTSSPTVVPPFDVFKTSDQFKTHNDFYGGQFGLDAKFSWCDFFLTAKGKLALGAMHETLIIKGQLTTNDFDGFGALQTFRGGYFALSTNIGHHSRTRFAIIPETNINLGYQILKWLNLQIGYTFLYVNKLTWASNQIDRRLNPTQAPAITSIPSTTVQGERRPKPLFKTEQFWAQGLNVGLEFNF